MAVNVEALEATESLSVGLAHQTDSVPIETFNAFVETVSSISRETDASEVALIIIEQTCRVLNCDRTSFFFVDGKYLDLVVGRGVDTIQIDMEERESIAGTCAQEGTILNIPNPYADERFNSDYDLKSGFKTESILAAPVVDAEGQILGVLQAINKRGGPFSEVDEKLMHCLAGQVGVSIRYTYQLEEAERATKQRNALVACIKGISTNTNVQHLLFTMNETVLNLVEADRCSFYTVNHQAETLSLIKSDAASDISFPKSRGLAGHVATTGERLNIEDAYDDVRFNQEYDRLSGFRTRSMLVLPVFAEYNDIPQDDDDAKRDPIAVLQVINKAHEEVFTHEDEDVLEVLLRFVGPAIAESPLFGNKKGNTPAEAVKMHDLSGMLTRKSSRELLTPRQRISKITEETGNHEDEDDDDGNGLFNFPTSATE